jgi:prepilin-type processing-associated H-X9-DG protein
MWFTSYAAVAGEHTLWPGHRPLSLDAATDGTSVTLLVVEACGQQIVWTEPWDVKTGEAPAGINLPGVAKGRSAGILSSYHTGGANVTLADGAVRFLNQDIDSEVLNALLTADGGDTAAGF